MMAETRNPLERASHPMSNAPEKIGDEFLAREDIRSEFKGLRLNDGGLQAPKAESVPGEAVAFATEDGADGGAGEDVGAAR